MSIRNRHLAWDIKMFQLIIEDFASTERGTTRFSWKNGGKIHHGGEYNWEFLETMKELFDGEGHRKTDRPSL